MVIYRSAEVFTVVVAVALLLAGVGSVVEELTVAVLEMTVPLAVVESTFTTMVKLALSPLPIVAFVHVTVPLAPTAGVVQVQPAAALSETKVVCSGSGSVTLTELACEGPPLLTFSV